MMPQVQALGLESALWADITAVIGLDKEPKSFRFTWLCTLIW